MSAASPLPAPARAPAPHPAAAEGRYYQILTAGRAGSTYLAAVMRAAWPQACHRQEAGPSRVLAWMSNIADAAPGAVAGPLDHASAALFRRSRQSWLEHHAVVIEVNPFLRTYRPAPVPVPAARVHLVRAPHAWVESAIGFGAYAARRHLAPILPYWWERPADARADWAGLSRPERWAWRWVWRNQLMRKRVSDGAAPGLTLRAEDLFEGGAERDAALEALAALFDLPAQPLLAEGRSTGRVNATPSRRAFALTAADRDAVSRITCGEAAFYGYDADAAG